MYCANCGSANPDDANFCAACGTARRSSLFYPLEPLFLHISVTKLILMSVASLGLYEAYWIYKNWKYINEREGLGIHPFWRGWFGIFFCHSLLQRIKENEAAGMLTESSFSVQLATGWVILTVLSSFIGPFVFFPGFLARISHLG